MRHEPITMLMAQPNQNHAYLEKYKRGETLLPKEDGEYTFLSVQIIYTKDTRPFKNTGGPGPDVFDTEYFTPGCAAPGDCLVLWHSVEPRTPNQQKLVTPPKPGLIRPN